MRLSRPGIRDRQRPLVHGDMPHWERAQSGHVAHARMFIPVDASHGILRLALCPVGCTFGACSPSSLVSLATSLPLLFPLR